MGRAWSRSAGGRTVAVLWLARFFGHHFLTAIAATPITANMKAWFCKTTLAKENDLEAVSDRRRWGAKSRRSETASKRHDQFSNANQRAEAGIEAGNHFRH